MRTFLWWQIGGLSSWKQVKSVTFEFKRWWIWSSLDFSFDKSKKWVETNWWIKNSRMIELCVERYYILSVLPVQSESQSQFQMRLLQIQIFADFILCVISSYSFTTCLYSSLFSLSFVVFVVSNSNPWFLDFQEIHVKEMMSDYKIFQAPNVIFVAHKCQTIIFSFF